MRVFADYLVSEGIWAENPPKWTARILIRSRIALCSIYALALETKIPILGADNAPIDISEL